MEADDQHEIRVGVEVDLAVGRVLHLLEQQAVVAEDGQRRPRVVAGDVELLAAADLHGKDVALRRKDRLEPQRSALGRPEPGHCPLQSNTWRS